MTTFLTSNFHPTTWYQWHGPKTECAEKIISFYPTVTNCATLLNRPPWRQNFDFAWHFVWGCCCLGSFSFENCFHIFGTFGLFQLSKLFQFRILTKSLGSMFEWTRARLTWSFWRFCWTELFAELKLDRLAIVILMAGLKWYERSLLRLRC